jgi:hypothetical protein
VGGRKGSCWLEQASGEVEIPQAVLGSPKFRGFADGPDLNPGSVIEKAQARKTPIKLELRKACFLKR